MRSIQEIYDDIISEKQTLASLNELLPMSGSNFSNLLQDLTAGSKVAIWRLWAYVIAVCIYTHEALFDLFKQEVQTIVATAVPGVLRWYHEQIFAFQFGYTLQYINGKYQYSSLDNSARIIKFCAVEERPDGLVVIKTAKEVASLPNELSPAELLALQAYCQSIKFAGTRISVVSYPADSLKLVYTIYYDPILPVATVKATVELIISNFLKNLPFNGRLKITSLTDALQLGDGIIDPVFTSAEARYGALPYAAFTAEYNSNAGYMQIDPAFPLSTTINYLPYV
jgi:hypothetical protein